MRQTTEPANAEDNSPVPNGNGNGNGRKLKPVHWAAILIVATVAVLYGGRQLAFMRSHATTDNAYLTADITQIAPQVAGTVTQILVEDNQRVKKGDVLVMLDDAKYRTAVDQAKANLGAAVADARAAGLNVDLARLIGTAQEVQAQGLVAQSSGGVKAAEADADQAGASIEGAVAAEAKAQADSASAASDVQAARANGQRARLAVASSQAQLDAAKAGAEAAGAGVEAARARRDYAAKDAARAQSLAESGVLSAQRNDEAQTALETARAAFVAAQRQADAAQSVVSQRQADLASAKEGVAAADVAITQALSRQRASISVERATLAQTSAAKAKARSVREGIAQAAARRTQAKGQLAQAETTPQMVSAKEAMRQQALAKVDQAAAALASAKLDLQRTRIVAPVAGRIGKKTVEVGALVQVGTPLMAVVDDSGLFVVANFKETQLTEMKAGQTVDIDVDGYGGPALRGRVDSIAAATGATFALLPADNATGNFVKVVQRIPVKVVFEPNQPGVKDLRAGMSASIAVKVR